MAPKKHPSSSKKKGAHPLAPTRRSSRIADQRKQKGQSPTTTDEPPFYAGLPIPSRYQPVTGYDKNNSRVDIGAKLPDVLHKKKQLVQALNERFEGQMKAAEDCLADLRKIEAKSQGEQNDKAAYKIRMISKEYGILKKQWKSNVNLLEGIPCNYTTPKAAAAAKKEGLTYPFLFCKCNGSYKCHVGKSGKGYHHSIKITPLNCICEKHRAERG